MTEDETKEAIRKVKRLWKSSEKYQKDDFTLRLNVWRNADLSEGQIEALINKAQNGHRHSDTVLSLLACIPLLKRDATPLEIWAYSIFEERAMKLRRGQKATDYVWRDAFISEMADLLLAEYPGLEPTREPDKRDIEPATSACAIVKFGLEAANVHLSESQVNKIYKAQHPDQIP